MKGLKKFLTGILAGAMALSLTLSAGTGIAAKAETAKKTITISKAIPGKEYTLYRVFDYFVPDESNTDVGVYKLSNAFKTNGFESYVYSYKDENDQDQSVKMDTFFKEGANGVLDVTGLGTQNDNPQLKLFGKAVVAFAEKKGIAGDVTMTAPQLTEAQIAAGEKTVTVSKEVDTYGLYVVKSAVSSVVSVDTFASSVTIEEKSSVPTVKKEVETADSISANGKKALAQIGKPVTFVSTVNTGENTINLAYIDKMDAGLDFAGAAGIKSVTIDGVALNYTYIAPTANDDFTFKLTFADGSYDDNKDIVIEYEAVVNESAVTRLLNDAYVTYGNGDKTEHDQAEVFNATIKVYKENNKNQPLKGAGFKLKNDTTGSADYGKYYKLTETTTNGKTTRTVTWVAEADASEFFSDETGYLTQQFVGLKNGKYLVCETTVPDGFNKADDESVVIKDADAADLELEISVTVINTSGLQLPSTGGIGTTIFYIIGGLLIVAAVVFFVVRRKADAE